MEKEIKRAKIFNYTISIMFLSFFVMIAVILGILKWNRTFTVSKWMNRPDDRYKIVSNMLSENKIIGMTEHEIIELLGKETENAPESFKYLRGEFPDENHLTYGLGVEYMDDEWLIITLLNGVATGYKIGLT